MTGCAAPRHGDDPPPAAPSAHLCTSCLTRLRGTISILPHLHGLLGELLELSAATRGGPGDGLHYNEPAAECRSQIERDIIWWFRELATIRGTMTQHPSCRTEQVLSPGELTIWCGWLRRQLTGWAQYRPFTIPLAETINSDRSRAMAILDPRPAAQLTIPADRNWCPQCETPGRLSAIVFQALDDKRPSLVTCAACRYEWTPAMWLRLGHHILRWAQRGKAA